MQMPKNWMKKTRKTYEVEADMTTTATKVDIAPWKTAEPVKLSAWSARSWSGLG